MTPSVISVMTVKRNLIANYLGRGWVSLVGLLFIPFYIHYLGIESYGVIGFYASVTAALAFLDFGLSQTLVREVARSGSDKTQGDDLQSLVGTLECLYWLIALVAAGAILILSPGFAIHWLKADTLPSLDLVLSIQIIGIVAALRWATGAYRSGLIGFQDQVWLSAFEAISSTVRSVGVVAVIAWLSPTVAAFFAYQGIVTAAEIFYLRRRLGNRLGCGGFYVPSFSMGQLRRVWRFTGSVAMTSILGSLISQLDKLLLPGLVSLEAFGYYMVAHALGRSLSQLALPVALAYRPVFANLVANHRDANLADCYHRASQLMAVAVIPVAIVIAVFSKDIIFLWTGNGAVAEASALVASLLALGTMFNALVNVVYSIQLAYGWTRLSLVINLVSAACLVPALVASVAIFGVAAAAWVWLVLNLAYVVFHVSITHKYYLIGEARRWYLTDTLPILASAAAILLLAGCLVPVLDSRLAEVARLSIFTLLAVAAAVLSASRLRGDAAICLLNGMNKWRR